MVRTPCPPVLLARAWHVFNKPLEPECKMKSLGYNFKDSSVFFSFFYCQEPVGDTRNPLQEPRALMAKVIAKSVLHWPRGVDVDGTRQKEGDK